MLTPDMGTSFGVLISAAGQTRRRSCSLRAATDPLLTNQGDDAPLTCSFTLTSPAGRIYDVGANANDSREGGRRRLGA